MAPRAAIPDPDAAGALVSRLDPGALRLSFAGLEPEQIREGLAVIGRIVTEELARTSKNFEPSPAMV